VAVDQTVRLPSGGEIVLGEAGHVRVVVPRDREVEREVAELLARELAPRGATVRTNSGMTGFVVGWSENCYTMSTWDAKVSEVVRAFEVRLDG